MSIIGWLVLGLIAGFIASKIVNKTGEGGDPRYRSGDYRGSRRRLSV
jgi:hypothetical protein